MLQIDLRMGKGLHTLQSLLEDGQQGSFDFAFVGASPIIFEPHLQLQRKFISLTNPDCGPKHEGCLMLSLRSLLTIEFTTRSLTFAWCTSSSSLLIRCWEDDRVIACADADKRGYPDYHELLLQLLRPGGVVVYDNMLWYGAVADSQVRRQVDITFQMYKLFLRCV